MARKNKRVRTSKLRLATSTLVVLAFFAFPVITTATWAQEAVLGPSDPRKINKHLEPIATRPVDKTDQPLRPFKQPIISVTFDDGWESIYSNALPLLQKYGIPTTQYILGGQFENNLYLSEKQVKSMQENGHEIASHTMTHENLTIINETDRRWELGNSQKILTEKFGPIRDFASPLGAEDDDSINSIKQFYRSNRNTEADAAEAVGEEDINLENNFDIYSINAFSVRTDTSIDEIKKLIEYAEKNNAWLVLTYHQVDYSGALYSVTPEVLEAQLKVVSESKSRIANMGDAIDAIIREEKNQ